MSAALFLTKDNIMTDRCKNLWNAVLLQAFNDACRPISVKYKQTEDLHTEDARSYLSNKKIDLITVCTLAGIEVDCVLKKAREYIGKGWVTIIQQDMHELRGLKSSLSKMLRDDDKEGNKRVPLVDILRSEIILSLSDAKKRLVVLMRRNKKITEGKLLCPGGWVNP